MTLAYHLTGYRPNRTLTQEAQAMQLLATSEDVAGESPEEKRSTAAVLTLLSRFVDGADRKAVLERATRVLKELAA